MIGLSDDEIEDIFKGIHSGKITPKNLPEDLYASIAEKLKEGLYKGFGSNMEETESAFSYGSASAELLKDLRTNIYLFAGAKTFQQTEEMRGLLVKDGKVLTYLEFQTKAKQTFDRYNEAWMQTEYNTAIGQAESARKWSDIQENKELFPFLKYNAVIDSHTSEICRPFDNLVLPVDDPFWSKFMPLNHYNCRCVVEQVERGDATVSTKSQIKKAVSHGEDTINEAFQMNAGKSGEIFSKDHPYFKEIPDKYKKLAENNFNLPIPEPPIKERGLTPDQKKEYKQFERTKTHSKEEAADQESSILQFITEKKKLTKEYIQKNGVIVNTDDARKLFDVYNGQNASAVHEASSAVSKEVVKKLLKSKKFNKINMYAGGAGSGKTSAIKNLVEGVEQTADAIIDGNMASFDGAVSKIGQYLETGRDLDIYYVYREPLDAWENGVIKRMLTNKAEMGRIVPLSKFIENTEGSLETIKLLIENGVDKTKGVNLKLIDNSLGYNKQAFMDQKKLKSISYSKDLRSQLEKRTKELYKEGKITKVQLEGLLK